MWNYFMVKKLIIQSNGIRGKEYSCKMIYFPLLLMNNPVKKNTNIIKLKFRRQVKCLVKIISLFTIILVDTGRKLNVRKTFRRRPGCLLNVLCTFNVRPASTRISNLFQTNIPLLCPKIDKKICFNSLWGTLENNVLKILLFVCFRFMEQI